MTTAATPCVICRQPDRIPNVGRVCAACRAHLADVLAEIGRLYAAVRLDRVAGTGDRVSGSREAPLPLDVDALDVTLPERLGTVSATAIPATVVVDVVRRRDWIRVREIRIRDQPIEYVEEYMSEQVTGRNRYQLRHADGQPMYVDAHDQIGHDSVLTILGAWDRDWRDTRAMGETLVSATVPILLRWLSDRLDWACDHHDAVDEFAAEMAKLHGLLWHMAGEAPAKPERLWTPCRRCDLLKLVRKPGEAYPVQCACGVMMTEDEYAVWSRMVAAGAAKGRMVA